MKCSLPSAGVKLFISKQMKNYVTIIIKDQCVQKGKKITYLEIYTATIIIEIPINLILNDVRKGAI